LKERNNETFVICLSNVRINTKLKLLLMKSTFDRQGMFRSSLTKNSKTSLDIYNLKVVIF